MESLVKIFCDFFDREIPNLKSKYNWNVPSVKGFVCTDQDGYSKNIEFKKYIKYLWDGASTDHNQCKLEIAEIIVKDWGGIRVNNKETLRKYVNAVLNNKVPTHLQGVASYSKIFAFVDPDRFAIYDSRVAACLNAVQINAKLTKGLAFNYVPGRNNIVGNNKTKQGFTQDQRFSIKKLRESGWHSINRRETYCKYIKLLNFCLKRRPEYNLTKLEMALFANAECECVRAMLSVPPAQELADGGLQSEVQHLRPEVSCHDEHPIPPLAT